jgi:hypothetical protein
LLCVKLWDVETAGEQIPIVGPQTAVVPLQNGIDAADRGAAEAASQTPAERPPLPIQVARRAGRTRSEAR